MRGNEYTRGTRQGSCITAMEELHNSELELHKKQLQTQGKASCTRVAWR